MLEEAGEWTASVLSGEQDWLAQRFEEQRPHLRAVAYRMLGSISEAEDAVQDAWLRLSRADTSEVENLRAWLGDTLIPSLTNLWNMAAQAWSAFSDAVVQAWGIVSPIFTNIATFFSERLDPLIDGGRADTQVVSDVPGGLTVEALSAKQVPVCSSEPAEESVLHVGPGTHQGG